MTRDDPLMQKLVGGSDIFFAGLALARLPIVLTDPTVADNPIVFANPAFLELCGYPREEVIGRNCRFLQGPSTDPATVAAMSGAVAGEQAIALDVLNYRKDGSVFTNAVEIHPICDEDGEVVYFFGSQICDAMAQADPRLVEERDLARGMVARCLEARRRLARRITDALHVLGGADSSPEAVRTAAEGARRLLLSAVEDGAPDAADAA